MNISGLTSAEAAELAGLTPGSFRNAMMRQRKKGNDYRLPKDQWPTPRVAMFDTARIKEWVAARKGGGS